MVTISRHFKNWFAEFVKQIDSRWPAKCPVKVVSFFYNDKSKFHARCECEDDYFVIKINRYAGPDEQFENLIHEWAHAITFPWTKRTKWKHGERWAKAYGKIYREGLRFIGYKDVPTP